MGKLAKTSMVVASIIIALSYGLFYYENSKLDGYYELSSMKGIHATLSIKDGKYFSCFHSCKAGTIKLYGAGGEYGDYIQFRNAGMVELGQALDAPLERDVDGNLTAVRFNIFRTIFGMKIVTGNPDTGDHDDFNRVPFKQANFGDQDKTKQ